MAEMWLIPMIFTVGVPIMAGVMFMFWIIICGDDFS